jgi:hypothetical protein
MPRSSEEQEQAETLSGRFRIPQTLFCSPLCTAQTVNHTAKEHRLAREQGSEHGTPRQLNMALFPVICFTKQSRSGKDCVLALSTSFDFFILFDQIQTNRLVRFLLKIRVLLTVAMPLSSHERQWCLALVRKLESFEILQAVFSAPEFRDDSALRVKTPMKPKMVRSKLGSYASVADFSRDVGLIWCNIKSCISWTKEKSNCSDYSANVPVSAISPGMRWC